MPTFGLFSVLECPPGRPPRDVYPELLDLFSDLRSALQRKVTTSKIVNTVGITNDPVTS